MLYKTTIPLLAQIVSIVVSDLVAEEGLDRMLRLRLAYCSLGDPISLKFGTRQPSLPKNDSLNHFLNGKTQGFKSFVLHNKKENTQQKVECFFSGCGGRT